MVITIIVLLILAGVTLNMLMGENGIVNQAQNAKAMHEEAEKDEQRNLENLEAVMSQEKYTYTDKNNEKVEIPAGFTPTGIDGEDTVDEGFVIKDAQGNEYVWVVVPKTVSVYAKTGLNETNLEAEKEVGGVTKTVYEWIRDDLKTYTAEYKDDNYNDYWYYTVEQDGGTYTTYSKDPITEIKYERIGTTSEAGILQETTAEINENEDTGCGLTYVEYARLYKAMLKSVYENGGFWIGRYEAGTSVARNSRSGMTETKVISKQNEYPFNFVTCSEAQQLASGVISGELNSSLMFGLQWDLVLRYLEEKGATEEELKGTVTGSKNWGNYADAEFTIQRGKYETLVRGEGSSYVLSGTWKDYDEDTTDYVENMVKKATTSRPNGCIILTTGASDINQKQNIYDLAGNIHEITLENSYSALAAIVWRGGRYDYHGRERSAATHTAVQQTAGTKNGGFRVTLY